MPRLADCALRPLTLADGERVLAWRNQDRVRANMYTDHVIAPAEHARWLERALVDERAAYRIFEHQGRPVGFVSFTDIRREHGRGTWAFYLGEADAPRGSGAAMEYLALDEAFGPLALEKLCCEVFVFNAAVIRLHHRFGFVEEGRFIRHYRKDGEMKDIVALARFAEGWSDDRQCLATVVFEDAVI